MLTSEDTFKKLKQRPYEEVTKLLSEIVRPPSVVNLGDYTFGLKDIYPEITLQLERIKLMEDNGWTYEQYMLEIERRAITQVVAEYNKNHGFPIALVDRAKRFYPNARFTEAKIELE